MIKHTAATPLPVRLPPEPLALEPRAPADFGEHLEKERIVWISPKIWPRRDLQKIRIPGASHVCPAPTRRAVGAKATWR